MDTVFRNRKAAFVWGFMAIWLAMLIAFTSLFLRDGVPAGQSPLLFVGVLAVFWIGGVGAASYAASLPLIEVRVAAIGVVRVRRRYLWRVEERNYGRQAPLRATLVEGRDSDNDPYFRARLELPEGDTIDLWEGHDRDHAQAEVERFQRSAGAVG